MRRCLLALSLLTAAAPAIATDPAPEAGKPAKEKRVCRREANLGTNIPHSICHTPAEWAQIDRSNREAAEQTIATGHQSGR